MGNNIETGRSTGSDTVLHYIGWAKIKTQKTLAQIKFLNLFYGGMNPSKAQKGNLEAASFFAI